MAASGRADTEPRAAARVVPGAGAANAETGLSVLDHLLGLLARHAALDVVVEVAPGPGADVAAAAGRALGGALRPLLEASDARGVGAASVPTDEALAHVALEVSGRPLLVSNVDLSAAHIAGLETDVVARFLRGLVETGGLTLHVRLLEGTETQHVLEAIFKALGLALDEAGRPRLRGEKRHG